MLRFADCPQHALCSGGIGNRVALALGEVVFERQFLFSSALESRREVADHIHADLLDIGIPALPDRRRWEGSSDDVQWAPSELSLLRISYGINSGPFPGGGSAELCGKNPAVRWREQNSFTNCRYTTCVADIWLSREARWGAHCCAKFRKNRCLAAEMPRRDAPGHRASSENAALAPERSVWSGDLQP